MWIGAVTLFPEMFEAVTAYGITGRAVRDQRLTVELWNPRDFTHDRHRTVDDRPYGGGPGMLMKIEPLRDAIGAARAAAPVPVRTIYMSPQGRPLNQGVVEELAAAQGLILIAGRYEGVDERILESEVDEEISLGDFVLSGGELGAMTVIDAVTRMLPGALGHEVGGPGFVCGWVAGLPALYAAGNL
jgi:tRNA (guanine37-N1)-methyltransferase